MRVSKKLVFDTFIDADDVLHRDRDVGDSSRSGEKNGEPQREPRWGRSGRSRARRVGAPVAMARQAFLAMRSAYLDAMRAYYRESTIQRYGRDLMTAYRDLLALREQGLVKTTTPSALAEANVEALLLRWRTRPSKRGGPLDTASQEKLIVVLDGFLAWCGNPVLVNLKRKRHVRLPHAIQKPVRVLDEAELEQLRRAAEAMEAWPGSVARFLVAFVPATGLRRKEFRLIRFQDLDVARWRVLVAHPKGEAAWAAPDYAPILPPGREATRDFLLERPAYLGGQECEWLVPYRRVSGELGPWSDAILGQLVCELARRSGVKFSLRNLRATFGQMAKDRGATIEAISRAMRHGSTRTTEKYYARVRADDAFRELERVFERPKLRVEPQ